MRELGVSRISLGVQSWNDRLLQITRSRTQRRAGARSHFEILRDGRLRKSERRSDVGFADANDGGMAKFAGANDGTATRTYLDLLPHL